MFFDEKGLHRSNKRVNPDKLTESYSRIIFKGAHHDSR